MTDLTDEVVENVLAKVRAGDVPEDIVRAAAADQPDNPAIEAYVKALIQGTGATDTPEALAEADRRRDEIIKLRLEPYVAERIIELMIARELERRVQAGEVIAHVGVDGETCYERAAPEFTIR